MSKSYSASQMLAEFESNIDQINQGLVPGPDLPHFDPDLTILRRWSIALTWLGGAAVVLSALFLILTAIDNEDGLLTPKSLRFAVIALAFGGIFSFASLLEKSLQRAAHKAGWRMYQNKWGDRDRAIETVRPLGCVNEPQPGQLNLTTWYEVSPIIRIALGIHHPPAVEVLLDGQWVPKGQLPGSHWGPVLSFAQERKAQYDQHLEDWVHNTVRREATARRA